MKRIKVLLLVVISLFAICACTNNEEMTDAKKFKEEYESLNGTRREGTDDTIRSVNIPENNPMIYKDANDIVNMINNKESFVVYFGFNECPWCRSVIQTLLSTANNLSIDKIYYVDVKDIRDVKEYVNGQITTTKEGSEGYNELIKLLNNVLSDYNIKDADGNTVNTMEKRIYAPNVITVINGVPTACESGISSLQTDPYMEITVDMINDTYTIFEKELKPIAEVKDVCDTTGC